MEDKSIPTTETEDISAAEIQQLEDLLAKMQPAKVAPRLQEQIQEQVLQQHKQVSFWQKWSKSAWLPLASAAALTVTLTPHFSQQNGSQQEQPSSGLAQQPKETNTVSLNNNVAFLEEAVLQEQAKRNIHFEELRHQVGLSNEGMFVDENGQPYRILQYQINSQKATNSPTSDIQNLHNTTVNQTQSILVPLEFY